MPIINNLKGILAKRYLGLPFISGILFLKITTVLILFFLLDSQTYLSAQEKTSPIIQDTLPVHSAKKATIMSMCLPGLGQAYNKKYWKIPVIYAGFGALIYFISNNGTEYRNFRTAYDIVATSDSVNFNNAYVVRYNANLNQLEEGRNYYRRNLELSWIFTGVLYILQVVDASVDANLYTFDVSDDLSFRFEPIVDPYMTAWKPAPALRLRYRF
jgi:hypothetical protein